MARNKFSGMSIEEINKKEDELTSIIDDIRREGIDELKFIRLNREFLDVVEMGYALKNNIPIENIENRFYGMSVHDIVIRYNDLIEELADMGDETPSSVFADRYRELADCLEMIGELEENAEG